jgi:hypothetical protein
VAKADKESNENNDLQAEIAELTHALKRERADAINQRRRHEEEIDTLRNRVKAHVIKDLLPIFDNSRQLESPLTPICMKQSAWTKAKATKRWLAKNSKLATRLAMT